LGDLSTSQKATYSATSTIYVGANSFAIDTVNGAAATAYSQQLLTTLIPTYEQMLQSDPVAADAAQRAGFGLTAGDVLAHTKVATKVSTTLLTVTATDGNPSVAEALANSVADAFAAKVQSLQPQTGQGAIPSAPAYVFQRAALPTSPLPTKTISNIVRGGLVGLVVGVALAGLLEYLDVTFKGPADAEDRLQLAVLGVIPLRRTDA
jgi:capsular polysaccharide biosynthesis protein